MCLSIYHLSICPSIHLFVYLPGLPWLSSKEFTCRFRKHEFNPWVRKIPWRKKCQPTPVLLPGKFHGQKRLMNYHPWGSQKSQTQLSDYTTTIKSSYLWFIYLPIYHLSIIYLLVLRKLLYSKILISIREGMWIYRT